MHFAGVLSASLDNATGSGSALAKRVETATLEVNDGVAPHRHR
jgi:hypothetical protein